MLRLIPIVVRSNVSVAVFLFMLTRRVHIFKLYIASLLLVILCGLVIEIELPWVDVWVAHP